MTRKKQKERGLAGAIARGHTVALKQGRSGAAVLWQTG